jgi:hypothetical protein
MATKKFKSAVALWLSLTHEVDVETVLEVTPEAVAKEVTILYLDNDGVEQVYSYEGTLSELQEEVANPKGPDDGKD